ncbi:MAG: hypothetical protein IPO31_27410 [Candidatus Obscuribacter sp.]|nr:hypothetical protein [Candidatus Obscuribacter sp.]
MITNKADDYEGSERIAQWINLSCLPIPGAVLQENKYSKQLNTKHPQAINRPNFYWLPADHLNRPVQNLSTGKSRLFREFIFAASIAPSVNPAPVKLTRIV